MDKICSPKTLLLQLNSNSSATVTNFQINLETLVFYVLVFNALVLAALLTFSNKNRQAARWLGATIFALAFELVTHKILADLFMQYPHFTLRAIPTNLAMGPLLYFYARRLLNYPITPRMYWWLLPLGIDILYNFSKSIYVYFYDVENRLNYFSPNLVAAVQIEFLIHDGLAILYTLFFLVRVYHLLQTKKADIQRVYASNQAAEGLKWLEQLLYVFLGLMSFWIGYHIWEISIFPQILFYQSYLPLHLSIAILLLYMGYRALLQPEITEVVVPKTKYQTTTITSSQLAILQQQLIKKVESEQLYLDPELKLNDLSERTEISPRDLSQVFSEGLDSSFYEFINSYRIQEVKKRLASAAAFDYTILAHAFAAGFNSKNAFYNAFKKAVGMSPSQFRKQQKKE